MRPNWVPPDFAHSINFRMTDAFGGLEGRVDPFGGHKENTHYGPG